MGTRADFYVARGANAEWIGSIAWDGYPKEIPEEILKAKSEEEYKKNVEAFLEKRDDGTLPTQGWPWPWEDSGTTDYAYAFDNGDVYACSYGLKWFLPLQEEEPESDVEEAIFPNMANKQRVAMGERSGLITFTR